MTDTLRVDGLKQLNKALAGIDKTARLEFRRELRAVGGIVKDEAKRLAVAHGLVDSGRLVAGIKLSVTNTRVAIYETASRDGKRSRAFPYPIIYEFGGRERGNRFDKTARIKNRTATGARLAAYGAAQGSHGQYGPRAFMYPALENKSAAVLKGMEDVLDKLADSFQGAA